MTSEVNSHIEVEREKRKHVQSCVHQTSKKKNPNIKSIYYTIGKNSCLASKINQRGCRAWEVLSQVSTHKLDNPCDFPHIYYILSFTPKPNCTFLSNLRALNSTKPLLFLVWFVRK